jgi:hypothetical protein
MATVALTYEDDTANPIATITAVNVVSAAVDSVNETTDAEIRYYLSAEHATADDARSPVFSGDYTWLGWIAPASGAWTFHLRAALDDSSVANSGAVTFDAP